MEHLYKLILSFLLIKFIKKISIYTLCIKHKNNKNLLIYKLYILLNTTIQLIFFEKFILKLVQYVPERIRDQIEVRVYLFQTTKRK